MKRITIMIIVVMLLVSTASGISPTSFQRYNADWFSNATGSGRAVGLLWMRAVELQIGGLGTGGTGKTWYVDSNVSNAGDASSFTNAVATLQEAIVLALADGGANRGDTVLLAQGHNEALTAADDVDITVAGITVEGLGQGPDRPRFDYDATGGEFVIGAAGVRIVNLTFLPGVTIVTHAIDIENAGDYAIIENCDFLDGEAAGTDEFVDTIQIGTTATNVTIIGCKYFSTGTNSNNFVDLSAATIAELSIVGNEIYGAFAEAGIWAGAAVPTNLMVAGNVVTNTTAGQLGIEFQGDATGWLIGNKVSTDVFGTSFDPGRLSDGGGNLWDDFDTYDTTGVEWARPEDGVNQLNATTITAIGAEVTGLSGLGFFGDTTTNAVTTTVVSADLSGYGDDYFNTDWSIVCILDATGPGSAPEGEIRDITDYVSTTGTFTVPAFTAAITVNDRVMVIRTEQLDIYFSATILGSSNQVWYLDDGGSDGDGKTWATAKTTLAAVAALLSDGDTVFVGKNHNENLTAGGDTITAAGVLIEGMGEGDARPLFDMDVDSDELTLNAAGITLRNLRFRPGATGLTSGIRVEATAIGCVIENCAFVDGEASGTDEWVDAISVDTLASNLTIRNCTFYNTGAPGTFINLDEATIANTTIAGNKFFGACTEAPIWGAAAVPTNLSIKGNDIQNTASGQFCIEFQGAATGDCRDNMLSGDTYGSILDPGSMRLSGNMQTVGIDAAAEDVPLVAGKSYARQMLFGDVGALQNIFSVTGSPIIIEHFWGIASVAIGGAATLNLEVDADSTHDYDLSTSVDIQAIDEGGSIAFTNAMGEGVLTVQPLGASGAGQALSWFCEEGMLESAAAGDTGNVEWYMIFKPVYSGGEVIPQTGNDE